MSRSLRKGQRPSGSRRVSLGYQRATPRSGAGTSKIRRGPGPFSRRTTLTMANGPEARVVTLSIKHLVMCANALNEIRTGVDPREFDSRIGGTVAEADRLH